MLYHLPRLKFLDSKQVSGHEREQAKVQGEFMRVVKPSDQVLKATKDAKKDDSGGGFNPLPESNRGPEKHRGTIGTCKYVYYGRHSEGNRFIRDDHL